MRRNVIGIAAVCAAILFLSGCSASKSAIEPLPTAEILPTPERIKAEEQTEAPTALPDFSALAVENENGESVFALSTDDFITCFNAVYRIGSIGTYGFYGSGTVEICFIPLTEGSLAILGQSGIALPDGKDV